MLWGFISIYEIIDYLLTKHHETTDDINMRISIDSAYKQRFTEEEIMTEFKNDNVIINKPLVCRKTDGAVMGQILFSN